MSPLTFVILLTRFGIESTSFYRLLIFAGFKNMSCVQTQSVLFWDKKISEKLVDSIPKHVEEDIKIKEGYISH